MSAESYAVAEFVPGLILIGSDGGGTAYALDTRRQPMPVVALPFIGMELEEAEQIVEDFDDLFGRMTRGKNGGDLLQPP